VATGTGAAAGTPGAAGLEAAGGAGRGNGAGVAPEVLAAPAAPPPELGDLFMRIAGARQKQDALLKKLGSGLGEIGRFKVAKFITTDGYKYLLPDNEWVAFRASGTEPLIRCYVEAKTSKNLKLLRDACRKLLS